MAKLPPHGWPSWKKWNQVERAMEAIARESSRESKGWGSERSLQRSAWLTFGMHLEEAIAHLKRHADVRYLPRVAIDRPDFAESLPSIPAVYFICRPPARKPLYVGRARNLKARWTRDPGKNAASLESEHHRLKAALKLRNAVLFWMKVPPDYLGIAEMLLIQMHKPKWNVVRR
jgi:hypothetical protein